MKRLTINLLLSAVILLGIVGLSTPTPAHAATCYNYTGNQTILFYVRSPYAFPQFNGITTASYTTDPSPLQFPLSAPFTATFSVIASGPWSVCLADGLSLKPLGSGVIFNDGRLNDRDGNESVAVYCEADGSVKALAIFEGRGYPAFTATPAEIARVGKNPSKKTVIKSGQGAFLYRLPNGKLLVERLEVNMKNLYSFVFSDCPVK